MLKYIGSAELRINKYGVIKKGDTIDNDDLCESLKHRDDFVEVGLEKPEKIEKPKKKIKVGVTPKVKKRPYKRRK